MTRSPLINNLRRQVAAEAARIMIEQGIDDFLAAKKKAAERLGLKDRAALPANREIENALLENRRLFHSDGFQQSLQALRQSAMGAMQLFDGFRPRLVGSVLSGAITAVTAIELHLFADNSEQVAMQLMDSRIEYYLTERRLRYGAESWRGTPVYCFEYDDADVEAFVFDLDGERQSPLSPVDGKPMQRIDYRAVTALIDNQRSDSLLDEFFA